MKTVFREILLYLDQNPVYREISLYPCKRPGTLRAPGLPGNCYYASKEQCQQTISGKGSAASEPMVPAIISQPHPTALMQSVPAHCPHSGRTWVCTKCGTIGADARPNWEERAGTGCVAAPGLKLSTPINDLLATNPPPDVRTLHRPEGSGLGTQRQLSPAADMP
jgi:hypothetical protein